MSETKIGQVPDEVGDVPKSTQVLENSSTDTLQREPTPTPNHSWVRRVARPLIPILGAVGLGGLAMSQRGSDESTKAPDAIVAPPVPGFETYTPEQIVEKARLEQVAIEKQAEQAKAETPEMSEDEKRQKITEVLQEVNPSLISLLENGPLPYYGENKEWGANFRVVSFVPKDAMPQEAKFNNKDLAVASNEHWFEIAMSGMPLSDFQTDGKLDMDKSRKHQVAVRAVKDRLVVILPSQMNGEPTPWSGKGNSDGMFLADTVLEGNIGKLQLLFDPKKVADAPPAEAHHADKRVLVSGGPTNGAS